MRECLTPGSNRRPFACEANVITNYTSETAACAFGNFGSLSTFHLLLGFQGRIERTGIPLAKHSDDEMPLHMLFLNELRWCP